MTTYKLSATAVEAVLANGFGGPKATAQSTKQARAALMAAPKNKIGRGYQYEVTLTRRPANVLMDYTWQLAEEARANGDTKLAEALELATDRLAP